uniref:Uncharacterized protein n=1 Tax=Helianthus annuus TaxID=4232 RepID=A0A251VG75_HELAN
MKIGCMNLNLQTSNLVQYDIDGKQRVTRMAWKTTPLWKKVNPQFRRLGESERALFMLCHTKRFC